MTLHILLETVLATVLVVLTFVSIKTPGWNWASTTVLFITLGIQKWWCILLTLLFGCGAYFITWTVLSITCRSKKCGAVV